MLRTGISVGVTCKPKCKNSTRKRETIYSRILGLRKIIIIKNANEINKSISSKYKYNAAVVPTLSQHWLNVLCLLDVTGTQSANEKWI